LKNEVSYLEVYPVSDLFSFSSDRDDVSDSQEDLCVGTLVL